MRVSNSTKAVVIWLAILLILSLYPFGKSQLMDFDYSDLLVHFILYAITGGLLFVNLNEKRWKVFWLSPALGAVAMASVYGFAMELAQFYMPRRQFSFLDAGANSLGAAVAVFIFYYIRNRMAPAKTGAETGDKIGAKIGDK